MILPPRKRTGLIGVDIGAYSVKVAQVERRGQRLRLVDAVLLPRRRLWPAPTEHQPPRSSISEIRAALEIGRFRGAAAAAALPRGVVDVRTMALPAGERSQIRESVAEQLRATPALGTAGRVFDFAELPSSHKALVASAPESWAAQICDDLRRAGARCQSLTCGAVAACNALRPPAEAPWAAVDWGCQDVSISVVRHGAVCFRRLLPECGLAVVLTALQAMTGATVEQTRRLMQRAASAGDEQPAEWLREAGGPAASALANQLRETLDYLESHEPAFAPQRCLLLGGGAALEPLVELLAERLPLPLEALSRDHLELPDDCQVLPPLFCQAIALSLSAPGMTP